MKLYALDLPRSWLCTAPFSWPWPEAPGPGGLCLARSSPDQTLPPRTLLGQNRDKGGSRTRTRTRTQYCDT